MRSLILGHKGMVGSAIHRLLPDANVDLHPTEYRFDLRNIEAVEHAFGDRQFDVVYLCAGRVGGIGRNVREPGRMLYDNLMIQTNVIDCAAATGVKKIVLLGSSCMYPAYNPTGEPWLESELLVGEPEPTNRAYAVAKRTAVEMLHAYREQYKLDFLVPIPCNLYGPGDCFDRKNGHFIAGMISKFHEAPAGRVTLWGTGKPLRELMHVDDAARIIVHLVNRDVSGEMNIGQGASLPISEYADIIRRVVAPNVVIEWDHTHPDGVADKTMNVDRMRCMGVEPQIGHIDGIRRTYQWYVNSFRSAA